MKTKIIKLPALMLCVSALIFLITINTHAASNVAPPAVNASLVDGVLRIEAIDGFYGVETIFIYGERFNYRVDRVIAVDARNYVGTGRTATIYAIDFAGK